MRTKVAAKIRSRWHRTSQTIRIVIIVLAVILVSARLALPYIVKSYVNRQLAKIPEYSGGIGDVTIHLWRGAYVIKDISIRKSEGDIPVPFFASPRIDLSVQWKELFHGAVVGKILLDQPAVNFVGGPTNDQKQTGESQPWGKTLESLFPFRINRFEITNGQVRFKNFNKSMPVDLYVTNLSAIATNLSNSRDVKNPLPAGLQATGVSLGGGNLSINLKMDPLADAPTFELNAALTNVDLPALNNFLRSYGKLDVEAGNLSVYTTTASEQGNYKGTVKVLFRNLNVFEWEKERKKNVLDIFWEAVVGVVSTTLKNQPHDQLAANIPVSGSFTNSHVSVLRAAGSLLHNAFIRALLPKIDRPEKVDDIKVKETVTPKKDDSRKAAATNTPEFSGRVPVLTNRVPASTNQPTRD